MICSSVSPVTGLVDEKSNIKLEISEMFVGNKKVTRLEASINLHPRMDLHSTFELEIFDLVLKVNDKIMNRHTISADLSKDSLMSISYELENLNSQVETHIIKLELTNIKNKLIKADPIIEMFSLTPIKETEYHLDFNYYKSGKTYYFSYRKNPLDARVFLKVNDNNWKEIYDNFSMHENELEGKINYLQLYTLDKENQRVYSNVIRIVKD